MNKHKTKKISGQNQTAPHKPSNKLFLLLALFVLGATNAWAALSAYEPFGYTLGSQILGSTATTATGTPTQTKGGGFSGNWGAGGASFTVATGLSYPGLLSGSNSMKIAVNGGYNQEILSSSLSSGTVYISYLFLPGTEASGGNNGAGNIDDGVQISPGGNGIFLGITSYGATQGSFGVNKVVGYGDFNANLWQAASPDITYGTTNFIVIKLVNSGGNNWNGSIWVNPTAGVGTEPAADGTFVMNGGGAIGTAAYVNRSGPGNSLTFDEMRFATTWSDAVSYTPLTPLNVAITSPANGSTSGNNITINANASIYPGTVTNVSFYDGATLLSSATTPPYSYSATLLAGAHTLNAIAYASSNSILVTATNTISITITDTPPLVVFEPFRYGTGSINGTAANGTGESGSWSAVSANASVASGSLAYTGITTSSNKLNVIAGRASVNFVNPIARGGTKWISYLMDMDGNCGANAIGVYLKNGGTGLWVGSGNNGVSSTTGPLYIGTTDTTAAGASGMTPKSPQFVFTYGAVYLVVLKIDFNTGGGNDTVTAFINPTAGTNTPTGYVAAITNSSAINVGTISGFGVQNPGCGNNFVDEVRVADSFGAVVGAPSPTVVTTVTVSTNEASTVSWTAYSTNVYQPQSSPDNSTWSNVGSQIVGSTPNSIVDLANAAYYQVLEYYPVTTEVVANGGLDLDTGSNPDTAQNWLSVQSQPPVWISTDGHTALGCMDLYVTNIVAAPNGSEMQQNTLLQGNPVTPGTSYDFSFWAKQISSGPSYVQQYNVQWLGSGSVFLGQSGVVNFSGGSGTWAHITQTGLVPPAGTVTALIQILGNTGAVDGGYGEVLIDDVSLASTTVTGGPNILLPAVQRSMSFTATINTNGITAGDATGTVNFKTNSIQLSVNTVTGGIAASSGTSINPPYTVTAIYSGDTTYLGSTGTLTVGSFGPSGSAVLTNSVSGGVLHLSWPPSQGWRLQMQTNSLSVGLRTNWTYITDGTLSSTNIPVDHTKPTVFYRLMWP